jgi:hypothetical protein
MADLKTINPSHPDVIQLTTDAVAELIVPGSGLPVSSFIGGTLRKAKAEGII